MDLSVEKKIIKFYKNGNSSYAVADQFDIGQTTVLDILERNNIKSRSVQEAKMLNYKTMTNLGGVLVKESFVSLF